MRKAIFLIILVFVVVFLCPKQAHAANPLTMILDCMRTKIRVFWSGKVPHLTSIKIWDILIALLGADKLREVNSFEGGVPFQPPTASAPARFFPEI